MRLSKNLNLYLFNIVKVDKNSNVGIVSRFKHYNNNNQTLSHQVLSRGSTIG